MEPHDNGAGDMGSKLSMPGGDPTARSPRTEGIHDAYKRGDPSRARHLLREACDESTSQLEKSHPGSVLTGPAPEYPRSLWGSGDRPVSSHGEAGGAADGAH